MRKVLIVGATSTIAQATARLFAGDGDELFLVGRNAESLSAAAEDLQTRGARQVETCAMDLNDFDRHPSMLQLATQHLGALDTVLIAHGTLCDQKACEASFERTLQELQTNCVSVISLLTHIARQLEEQGHGTIAVISSVAGDRGRKSNYVYGTAKAAVSTFLQGLRARLHHAGVHVLTVKPGFVDTRMTADFTKGFLWAKPETVARAIYRAIKRRKEVVYTPWFWRPVMLIIKSLPESLFKRLNL